jgi:hypothetical protein
MSRIDPPSRPPLGRLFFVLLAALVAAAAMALVACGGSAAEPAVPEPAVVAGIALVTVTPEPMSVLPSPVIETGATAPSFDSPSQDAAPVSSDAPASPTPAPTVFVEKPPTPPVTPLAAATASIVEAATLPPLTAEPLPTPAGVYSWTLKVPILMYHYVSSPPEGSDVYRVDLSVTPEQFREQMAYLRDNGYTTVDFYDLSLAITNQRPLPEKPVMLSFDDGYRDNYEAAFPILKEYGHKGVFFVVSEFIDKGRAEYVTWDMVM